MSDIAQPLRELIRQHVTGPAVEAAEIGDDYVLDPELAQQDAVELSTALWGRFGAFVYWSDLRGIRFGDLATVVAGWTNEDAA